MMNCIQKGEIAKVVASSNVDGGGVVVVGTRIGVACSDIAEDATGSVAMEGVYRLPKATGTIIQGADVYWEVDGNPVGGTAGSGAITTTATDNVEAGYAFESAAENASTVLVKLRG